MKQTKGAPSGMSQSTHRALWGKADPARAEIGPTWHPLIAHMLDVAACAEELLVAVHRSRLEAMADLLGMSADSALPWLLLFVVLHDLGKATPAFQAKVSAAKERLSALGYDFPDSREPHGEMSTVLLPGALEAHGVPSRLAVMVARSVGAHHGSFAQDAALEDIEGVPKHVGKRAVWQEARTSLVADLVAIFRPAGVLRTEFQAADLHGFCVDLAGLTTAADWLGSNAEVFGYVTPDRDWREYFEVSRSKARASVAQAGFRAPPRAPARDFETLFGKAPWPLHEAMQEVAPNLAPGSLLIVEAAMGEGKTEAALLAYDVMSRRGAEGFFFALPTQATANQILGRVERYLQSSFPGRHGLHLVHGGAGLSDRYDSLKHRASSVDGVAGADDAAVADAWFCRSKRALLAPFGVGTVDQALYGVLRTKHHFLRMHGLAGKVLIIDEVHAYDTFTSSILARLCEWLSALGATVVLLSATLSSPQRRNLLRAYGSTADVTPAPYPRLTIARRGETPRSLAFASRRAPVSVALEWHAGAALEGEVAAKVRSGGCVVWIVNTVARAQTLYRAMKALLAEGSVDLQLLHARFPFSERQAREAKAEGAFGPPGLAVRRPASALLIGTQVLEQSLDFDFDLMITEMAPVDLMLQRAGRLHRHQRDFRPAGLETRTLWIEEPAAREAGPDFGPSVHVYDEAILLASYLALKARSSVSVPTDIEPLVEAVYVEVPDLVGDVQVPDALVARLRAARARGAASAAGEGYQAELKELPSPAHDSPFGAFSCAYEEEDPRVHKALKAVTRLGDPSVTVVPVRARGAGFALFTNPAHVFSFDDEQIAFPLARALARGSLSISRPRLVNAILDDPRACPRAFERTGLLRHYRLLILDENGHATTGGTPVALDPELGLLIGTLAADRGAQGTQEEE